MFRKALIVAALSLVASPVLSATHTYTCQVKSRDGLGWVPKTLQITHDTVSGHAEVMDPVIQNFNDGAPLNAQVAIDNDARTTFAWSLRGAKDRRNQQVANFSYCATFYEKNNKVLVTAKPLRFTNNLSGRGVCKKSVG